jgi:hypothetical protein
VFALLSAAAVDVLAAIPNPGQGTPPPGSGGLLTILGWAAWCVFAVIVGGVLIQAGRMGLAHRRGEGVEVTGGLVVALVAAVIAGSASAIVGAVLV